MNSLPMGYFLFKVKSCQEAHIALTDKPTVWGDYIYDIIIGADSNTQTQIWKKNITRPVSSTDTDSVLNCDEDRQFWLGYSDGTVEVGRGDTLGQGLLVNYRDPQKPKIFAASLASGPIKGAEWSYKIQPSK